MRISACLLIAILHALLAAAFISVACDADIALFTRCAFGVTALAVLATAGLLAARPFRQLPSGAVRVLRGGCIALPLLYGVASLDHGMISGLEGLVGLIVAGVSWVTWRTFVWAKPPSSPTA